MPIDSAQKRFSIMNMRSPIGRPSFIPDGTIDDGDRYHLINLYFGIALDFPTIAIDATLGLLSIIQVRGQGVLSSITSAGQSALSTVSGSTGLLGIIQSRGQGISSPIDETGQSVESSI